ncbi:nicotinamidase-related amidase [Roseateles terrae]|uniref:Nicotinamidase-related amidase n=1 Tax=Roseateles terrae TaxID=431060 RepID=A0ABR6GX41_9BURK|nr:nicotinamidase-related amidase [Roseateles terrae]
MIVIDLQNDYFPEGAFPLADTDAALAAVLRAIAQAHQLQMPVVLVQHLADPSRGTAPFFNEGTEGAALHPAVRAAAPDAPVIVKRFADSFERTPLHETLQRLGVDALVLCGMMTHNCVTHTALSRQADHYRSITVLKDACSTVSPLMNAIALNALSTRVTLAEVDHRSLQVARTG